MARNVRQIKRQIQQRPGPNPGLQRQLRHRQMRPTRLRNQALVNQGVAGAYRDPTPMGGSSNSTKNPGVQSQNAAPYQAPKSPVSGQQLMSYNPNDQASFANLSSYNPSGGVDPRDGTYYANLARLISSSQQEYAGNQLAQSQSDITHEATMGDLQNQRKRGITDLAESMIGTGLLRSGHHNRSQTRATDEYVADVDKRNMAKGAEDAERKAKMDAILSMLGIEEQGLYEEASGRYSDLQSELAETSPGFGNNPGAGAWEPPGHPNKRKRPRRGGGGRAAVAVGTGAAIIIAAKRRGRGRLTLWQGANQKVDLGEVYTIPAALFRDAGSNGQPTTFPG